MPAASQHDLDARFMAAAIRLGGRELGRTWPNPAVGALIVRDDGGGPVVVGRGWTKPGGRPHAEVVALREAGDRARGATCYVSLEPCSHHGKTPPCVDALTAAGIARVVSAIEDPDMRVAGRGHARLRDAGIAVETGLCADEAAYANAGHIMRVRRGRPWVTLKLAVSRDGMIAGPGGRTVAITGEEARGVVHLMRARNDAILVGIGTVLADDPQLTCRLPGMADFSPVRMVLDTGNRMPATARMLGDGIAPVWQVVSDQRTDRSGEKRSADNRILAAPVADDGRLDMEAVLKRLAGEGITRVMVEGGAQVAESLAAAGLIDEAVILTGDIEIGANGIPAGSALAAIRSGGAYRRVDDAALGVDTMTRYLRDPKRA